VDPAATADLGALAGPEGWADLQRVATTVSRGRSPATVETAQLVLQAATVVQVEPPHRAATAETLKAVRSTTPAPSVSTTTSLRLQAHKAGSRIMLQMAALAVMAAPASLGARAGPEGWAVPAGPEEAGSESKALAVTAQPAAAAVPRAAPTRLGMVGLAVMQMAAAFTAPGRSTRQCHCQPATSCSTRTRRLVATGAQVLRGRTCLRTADTAEAEGPVAPTVLREREETEALV